jgi:signal transduction histidine kinase
MLTVRDNGVGPGQDPGSSLSCHGLRLLRERARLLGGSLSIAPGPQGGTALTLIFPKS